MHWLAHLGTPFGRTSCHSALRMPLGATRCGLKAGFACAVAGMVASLIGLVVQVLAFLRFVHASYH